MNNGKKLETEVLHLLQSSGKEGVQTEVLIGSKRCDLYFESSELGFTYRTAVECKDYAAPLTKAQVTRIVAEYIDLLGPEVDRLLIVTRAGINATATRKVLDYDRVSHITITDFERQILDFSQYVRFQAMEFREELAEKVYVPCKGSVNSTQTISNLHAFLKNRLSSSEQPTALIGGYGTGKTTTAKHIFLELADAHLADPREPIPIFVPLSRMTQEQSIQGLLGAIFTAEFQTPGYNYFLFKHLSRNGRLVIFFDGFDEMRQKLSWEEFVKILENLNEVTASNNHVLFSGRPTAFLSEAEYALAIHGQAKESSLLDRELTAFDEVEITGFDEEAIFDFVKLVEQRGTEAAKRGAEGQFNARQRSRFLDAYRRRGHIRDLSSRPVQLDMICKVIPMIEGDVGKITTVMIYDLFVKSLIDRDVRKSSRQSFKAPMRRAFSKDVAWWLWGQVATSNATASDIPNTILERFKEPGDDQDSILRDLVVGSFFTSRRGREIFFPHRSIQEFLVAEFIFEAFKGREDQAQTISIEEALDFVGSGSCNDEIVNFAGQMIDALVDETESRSKKQSAAFGASDSLRELNSLFRCLSRKRGALPARIGAISARSYRTASTLMNIGRREDGRAHVVLVLNWLAKAGLEREPKNAIIHEIASDLHSMNEDQAWRALCFLVITAITENQSHLETFLKTPDNTFGDSAIKYEPKSGMFNISALYKRISPGAKEVAVIDDWILGDSFRIEGLSLPQRIWRFVRD